MQEKQFLKIMYTILAIPVIGALFYLASWVYEGHVNLLSIASLADVEQNNSSDPNFAPVGISACTGEVEQAACYVDYPRPILHWNCEAAGESVDEYSFALQLDDQRDFSSPELDLPELLNRHFFYEVSEPGLTFETGYHWRIKVKNSAGDWSDWAESDEAFTTTLHCQ